MQVETTVKPEALDPLQMPLYIVINPVVDPAGTVALINPALTTVNVVADVPLNLTFVTPVKLLPVIETTVPVVPVVGENDVTVGELTTETPITLDCDEQVDDNDGIPISHEIIDPVSAAAIS